MLKAKPKTLFSMCLGLFCQFLDFESSDSNSQVIVKTSGNSLKEFHNKTEVFNHTHSL